MLWRHVTPNLPFHIQTAWVEDGQWHAVLACVDRLTRHGRAASSSALRAVFPPSLTPDLVAMGHPVVAEQRSYVGRLRLLELGLAISITGANDEELGRLRNAAEYEGVAAELRAALLFARARANLRRPVGIHGKKQCERIATFPTGERIAVEVKLPDAGERELSAFRAESSLISELLGRFAWLRTHVSEVRATFYLAPGIVQLVEGVGCADRRVSSAIDEAVERVRSDIARGWQLATRTDLGAVGSLAIRSAPGTRGIQFDTFIPSSDDRKVSGRLTRNLLAKAGQQVAETGLPGVIVLDLARDSEAINAVGLLRRWAQRRPSVGAMLIVDRTVMGGDGRMYGTVDVVPGPRFAEVSSVLASALDTCSDGHLHYNPLCSPTSPCPMTWLPGCAA